MFLLKVSSFLLAWRTLELRQLQPPGTSLAHLSSFHPTHSSIVPDWRNSLETHQKIHMILSFSPAFSQPTCCGSPPNSPLRLCTRQGRLYPDKYVFRFWNHSFCLPINTYAGFYIFIVFMGWISCWYHRHNYSWFWLNMNFKANFVHAALCWEDYRLLTQ